MGDQVLYDDSLKYHRKLESKWIGSQTIIEVMYNESYKVANHMRVRAQPINDDHLNLYQKRDDLQIIVEAI